ncbi:hypothetical protein ROA7450_03356 [Roseovarius albus]|uniref:Uncharacterized protein n=1 Tax=Roseovarius albus TaxID=1247867 RepID=A0A1X6ZWI7_9RHOB|nr:hypothetical protein ROA7450_03356 [Roseovarius albus]
MLVPVSTFYDGCDSTCELDEGDHPFITHLSYVFYNRATIYRADDLGRGLQDNRLVAQPDMDEVVFAKVEVGIYNSPDTPRGVKLYLNRS